VWWTWTAPRSGTFTIDTIGSNYDTYLSVFTGVDVSSLSLVAADDDGAGFPASLISLNATAGETYQIAVDGFGSNTGEIQLNIAPSTSEFAGGGNLTEIANADTINSLPNSIAGKPANNTLQEEARKAPLTGGTGADTLKLPLAQPSVSVIDPVTHLAGSEKAGNLTETAPADTINGLPNSIAGKPANNTLKEVTGKDPLTGGTGADTLKLPLAQPSVSDIDPVTDFAGSEKIGLPTQGEVARNAPSLFSPAVNSTVPTLEEEEKGVIPVFTGANGGLAANQPQRINSDPFRVAANPYLVGVVEPKPLGFEVA
jgi:Ca2+-binding RTX toxin-like protein